MIELARGSEIAGFPCTYAQLGDISKVAQWADVRKAHFQSSIHRPIESRFAIVRAATNGISAIVSPTGKRLVVSDRFKDGPGLLMADVEVHDVRTIFSRFGHWFVVLSGVFVAVHAVLCRVRLSPSSQRRVRT